MKAIETTKLTGCPSTPPHTHLANLHIRIPRELRITHIMLRLSFLIRTPRRFTLICPPLEYLLLRLLLARWDYISILLTLHPTADEVLFAPFFVAEFVFQKWVRNALVYDGPGGPGERDEDLVVESCAREEAVVRSPVPVSIYSIY